MEALAIGVLLLVVFVLVSSQRPASQPVIFVVERPSTRPSGCLLLLVLAIVTFLAVSR
ncbi:MAG TPA: hypothetical protein VGD58_27655 [Herpetosiphonaceae bacterium]